MTPQTSDVLSNSSESTIRSRTCRSRAQSNFEDLAGISSEEEKLLAIAIKNSLRESSAKLKVELNQIQEMKTYRPSEAEFGDPIAYIEQLYKEGAQEYGCIKIIPPEGYNPPVPIDESSDQKLPTRFQTLQNLSMAKVSSKYL